MSETVPVFVDKIRKNQRIGFQMAEMGREDLGGNYLNKRNARPLLNQAGQHEDLGRWISISAAQKVHIKKFAWVGNHSFFGTVKKKVPVRFCRTK